MFLELRIESSTYKIRGHLEDVENITNKRKERMDGKKDGRKDGWILTL